MRKFVILLFIVGLSFTAAVFAFPNAKAKPPAVNGLFTIVQGEPGTRCSRLPYKDMEKRLKTGNTRCKRSRPHHGEFLVNSPPAVAMQSSPSKMVFACPGGTKSSTCNGDMKARISASATDSDGDSLLYTYSVTGGRITGDGPNAAWDLSSVQSGEYTATVEVDDGCGCIAFASTTVAAEECTSCR